MGNFKNFLNEGQTFKVPVFKTEKDMNKFIHSLPGAGKLAGNVVNPDTGELVIEKGSTKKKAMKPSHINITRKFGSFDDIYAVKLALLSKMSGLTTSELSDVDIEDMKLPEFIQRKDGFKLDSEDEDEIEMFLDDLNTGDLDNVRVSSLDNKGKKLFISYELL